MRRRYGPASLAGLPLVLLFSYARASGREIQPGAIFNGHESSVYCVATSPIGGSIASGARDGTVICWDLAAGRPRWTVKAHEDIGNGFTQVLAVAFSPDGRTLASGGWDNAVRLWDAASGAPKRTLLHEKLVYSVAFSLDGKTLAGGEHNTGVFRLWDVASGELTGVWGGGGGSVWSVAFSPDGKALASGGYVARRGGGGVVRLWDLSRGSLALEIPAQPTSKIALSPDGRLVAATGDKPRAGGGHDGLLRLWDTRTGDLKRSWTVVGDGRTSLDPVAFSPDGRLVAAGGMMGERVKGRKAGEICLWDLESNRLAWRQSGHDDDVTGLAFTADGKALVSGGLDKAVKLWEVAELIRRAPR